MIKHRGRKWIVTDHTGRKVLGTHDSEASAKRQLQKIEIEKHKK